MAYWPLVGFFARSSSGCGYRAVGGED